MKKTLILSFTLIELLVVIAIIATLAGLLAPSLRAARDAGRSIACVSNLRQIYITLNSYAQENDGQWPFGGQAAGGGTWPGYDFFYPSWVAAAMLYSGECTRANAIPSYGVAKGIWKCPGNPASGGQDGNATSYCYNQELGWNYVFSNGMSSQRPLSWSHLTEIAVLADGAPNSLNPPLNYTFMSAGFGQYVYAGFIHRGGCNVVFLDGHAGFVPKPYSSGGLDPFKYFTQGMLWAGTW